MLNRYTIQVWDAKEGRRVPKNVTMEIDAQAVAQFLGDRAYDSKGRRAMLLAGAILVIAED